MFTIDIAPFGLGQHEATFRPTASALELEEEDTFRDIVVDAHLFCQRDRVLVMFEVRATAALTCDRTLQPFEQEVAGRYSVLFAIPDTAKPASDTDEYEEVRDWHPSETELELTDAVRDTLLLSLPQRRVAPGAEDEEIPTHFGTPDEDDEGPIDPRWEKLRELKTDEEDSDS